MRSKTSCFNTTLFRKNLTRFAPVWGLYTLCLVLGIVLLYTNGGTGRAYHFAANLAELGNIMGVVNLFYAPVVAQCLFGDLYSSRMCYALHAMPVRRETFLVTNILSGYGFSLVPTLVMALTALPLTAGSCFTDAWQLPLYAAAAANLQFVCFFGMAVLCVMCTGTRLTMAILYALVNYGAMIVYWLIDTLYTPMLYGVVTPTALANNLTPIVQFTNHPLIETDSYGDIYQLYMGNWQAAEATFRVTENWHLPLLWAAVGMVLLLVAWILYRKRHLECAGDAMAFRWMEPVFQVIMAVVSACFTQFFLDVFIGYGEDSGIKYLFLLAGLSVGWIGCRMLIERSTRVFRAKTLLGLAGLTAVLAASLLATQWDILGIEVWQPKLRDIEKVSFGNYGSDVELTGEEDFRRILAIQEEALGERLEYDGPYVIGLDGSWVYNIDSNSALMDVDQRELTECRFAFDTHITYRLKSGKEVVRRYTLWSDGPGADAAREYLSSWEDCIRNPGYQEEDYVDQVLQNVTQLQVDGMNTFLKDPDPQLIRGLVDAVRLDCESHTMAQYAYLHTGHFHRPATEIPGETERRYSISLYFQGEERGWWVDVYPDSENTVRFLQEQGLLCYDISEYNLHFN